MEPSVLFRGATVVDGTGAPSLRTDVAVEGDRIAAVAPGFRAEPGQRVIEADGLVLAPGFIDMHSHADFTLPSFPGAVNSLSQGVTAEVVGNCGYSPAPLSEVPAFAETWPQVSRGIGPRLDWSWRSFDDYLSRLDSAHPAVNCLPLVGFGALRAAAMGMQDRPASDAEIETMRAELRAALAGGAWGMSTGLVYPPGAYAKTDEIVAVAEPLRTAGALYASHIRNEADALLEAVDEAIGIGRQLRVRVEISHLKAAGIANYGKVTPATQAIAQARREGLDVYTDAYPYEAGSTFLSQLLPPWVHAGGVDAMLDRLRSSDMRRRIRGDVDHGLPGWPNLLAQAGNWDRIMVASVGNRALAQVEGGTIGRLAADANADPFDWTLDLLIEDRAAPVMIITLMDAADVDAALAYEATVVGSDQLGVTSDDARVHPRCYGTFTRILGRYVRERNVLTLEDAVHRMTGLPATILGLADRGRIAAGAVADLVLFDPSTVIDEATYEEPTRHARGVEAVLLGGRFGVDRGQVVARDLGTVVRRPATGA